MSQDEHTDEPRREAAPILNLVNPKNSAPDLVGHLSIADATVSLALAHERSEDSQPSDFECGEEAKPKFCCLGIHSVEKSTRSISAKLDVGITDQTHF